MQITASLVVILLIAAAVMVRKGMVRIPPAIVLVLLGFYLAGTGVAPTINDATQTAADMVRDIDI